MLSHTPSIYALPGRPWTAPGSTFYRVFVGKGDALDWQNGARIPADFPNGQGHTLLIVEAATAAPWTKPDELPFDPNHPLPPLGGHYGWGFTAVRADAYPSWISGDTDPEVLIKAIRRSSVTADEVLGSW